VIELAATEISYGPEENSVFEIKPAPGAKIVEPHHEATEAPRSGATTSGQGHPQLRAIGHGITSVLALESPSGTNGAKAPNLPSGVQKVNINGVTGYELPTELGTLLSFERAGVNYLLVGALNPPAVEAAARGL
jgi:hypothetical protein